MRALHHMRLHIAGILLAGCLAVPNGYAQNVNVEEKVDDLTPCGPVVDSWPEVQHCIEGLACGKHIGLLENDQCIVYHKVCRDFGDPDDPEWTIEVRPPISTPPNPDPDHYPENNPENICYEAVMGENAVHHFLNPPQKVDD